MVTDMYTELVTAVSTEMVTDVYTELVTAVSTELVTDVSTLVLLNLSVTYNDKFSTCRDIF